MKKWIVYISLALISLPVLAQKSAPEASNDPLLLKETEYNFGKIPQGKPVTHIFKVTNQGKSNVSITNISASCGCTTPEWSKEPVAPGGTTEIKVGYNAAAEGNFQKTITLFYGDDQTRIITIKGEVWKAPTASAPVNHSLQILKNSH
jgi:Protein of unknown function (DUF1573)